MRTVVTSYPPKSSLPDFFCLASKYYPVPVTVDHAMYREAKSDQLMRLMGSMQDEHFILMEDDFLLVRPVDLELLGAVQEFCAVNRVDRFSLQTKNAHQCSDWTKTEMSVSGHAVYRANDAVAYPFSLEASIFSRQCLLSLLKPGWSDSQIEVSLSRLDTSQYRIYALDVSIMDYRDGMRDGKQMVKLLHDPLRLQVSLEDVRYLYPGSLESTVMLLKD